MALVTLLEVLAIDYRRLGAQPRDLKFTELLFYQGGECYYVAICSCTGLDNKWLFLGIQTALALVYLGLGQ